MTHSLPSTPMELMVKQLAWESDDVLSIVLVDPERGRLPGWTVGAHVDVRFGTLPERQFSLCGDPADRRSYRLGILREPDSRGVTRYVHERLRPGHHVLVGHPRNHFELVPARRYLFVAGGIGITPVLPMIREATTAGADWRLLYGGRRRSSMAFLDELAEHGDRVVVRPEDECGRLDLDSALADPDAELQVYCCGPESLLKAVESRCMSRPAGSLHTERFHPDTTIELDRDNDTSVDVICLRSDLRVSVPPGMAILDAVRDAGVQVDSSCEEGICGTCETRVLEGVPDHRDSLLTDTERAEGKTMMICCSRARSPILVLDL